MKEIPILYSTPMVQAKLAWRKKNTRRIIKPKSAEDIALLINLEAGIDVERCKEELIRCSCPYGQPGDLLWGRETAMFLPSQPIPSWIYKADVDKEMQAELKSKGFKWKPSIHVPKVASRIWDRVLEIRIERIQDISEEDAIAEGVEYVNYSNVVGYKDYMDEGHLSCKQHARNSFFSLWHKINGADSLLQNPWVWVIVSEQVSTIGKPKLY